MVRLLVVEFVESPDVFGFPQRVERVAKVRRSIAVDDAHNFALDAGGCRGVPAVGVFRVAILVAWGKVWAAPGGAGRRSLRSGGVVWVSLKRLSQCSLV